jgi:hypothetical protein
MPRKDELESVFEEARQHLASLPEWKITSETRNEIARLSATAIAHSEPPGRGRGSSSLKVKAGGETGTDNHNRRLLVLDSRTLFRLAN